MIPQLTLDHVGFVGSDLGAMIRAARRLGLAPTEPEILRSRDPTTGAAVSLEQSSCHVVLPSGYLELTSVTTTEPSHHLAAWRHRGLGCHILALGTPDLEAVRASCIDAGLAPTAVASATRRIDYGARRGDAQFDWFMLSAAQFAPALLCVVRNRRPELVFQPEVQRHPLGARALAAVTLVVDAPQELLRTALAWLPRAVETSDGEYAVRLLVGELRLISRAAAARRWREAFTEPRWAAGGIAALDLEVVDLHLAEQLLRQKSLSIRAADAELQIGTHDGNGAVIVLR